MQSKIVGIGKCGSRVTYDVFAYVSKMPSSYKIRVQPPPRGSLRKLIQSATTRLKDAGLHLRVFLNDQFGESLIAQMPSLVTVDSDIANNEIFNWVSLLVENADKEKKEMRFPGRSRQLANRTTGCDHHIVSENICSRWQPENGILSLEDSAIFAVAFSVGGGTGGGAGPVLLSKAAQHADTASHFMALGVLPKSDEPLFSRDIAPVTPEHEKYSTGRFFSGFLGNRSYGLAKATPKSLWMLSNDLLRTSTSDRAGGALPPDIEDPGIAVINRYLASAFTNLANSSSPAVISDSNLDAQELNNRLNGAAFFSGWGYCEPDVRHGNPAWSVAKLVQAALTNGTIRVEGDDLDLQGLSVPLHIDELEHLTTSLELASDKGFDSFFETLSFEKLPLEFRTAREIVLIHGESESAVSPIKAELLERVVARIFSNSRSSFYHFRQKSEVETLLVFIIDPFMRVVQNAMYYYLSRAWIDASHGEITTELDQLIGTSDFQVDLVSHLLLAEERLEQVDVGEATLREVSEFASPIAVAREDVVAAIGTLHRQFHWKKGTVRRSSLG